MDLTLFLSSEQAYSKFSIKQKSHNAARKQVHRTRKLMLKTTQIASKLSCFIAGRASGAFRMK